MSPSNWWHYRRSLASRVTVLTAIAVALCITAISLGGYIVLRHQLQASTDEALLKRAEAVLADKDGLLEIAGGQVVTMPTWALEASGIRAATVFADSQNTVYIPDHSNTPFPRLGTPERAVAAGKTSYSIRTITQEGTEYRVVAVPIPGYGEALVLAQSLESQHRMFARLGWVMAGLGLCGVVLAGLFGWAVATGGLRPVRRLTSNVERIARTEEISPMPVEGHDEIARLTVAFNGMLSALAASRDRERQLVADASHELRTPLTSLRTNIDLLTQADASITGPQREELLADLRAQIEEMTTLIGDMVELARDEPAMPVVEAVDLEAVFDHALERVRRRAPSITWEVRSNPWWVVGEAGGVERAITNLLDNAAKYSPGSSTVHVTLDGGTLTVDDEGPGIPEDDLPHVFDRFYRSAESRAMPGSGLGLAIVRQVAERTGGSVTAGRSPYGGARLVLRLPGSARPMPRTAPTGVL